MDKLKSFIYFENVCSYFFEAFKLNKPVIVSELYFWWLV